jgi:hypothetical protein
VTLDRAVELVQVVGVAEADEAIGLAHHLLEPPRQVLVLARPVAEDHPQRDVVEELFPVPPFERGPRSS